MAIFEDALLFKRLVASISSILGEAKLQMKADGVFISGIDDSRSAYVRLHISSDVFYQYDVNEDIEAAISLSDLKRILGLIRKTDTIELGVDKKNLYLAMFRGAPDDRLHHRRFTLPLYAEPLEVSYGIDEYMEQDVIARLLNPDEYIQAMSSATIMGSDYLDFIAREAELLLATEGEIGKYEAKIYQENMELEIRRESLSTYRLDLLKRATIKNADVLTLSFAEEKPLYLRYELGPINLEYLIAPMKKI